MLIQDLSLEQSVQADEKARSGSMFGGGIVSGKLRGILCVQASASISRE